MVQPAAEQPLAAFGLAASDPDPFDLQRFVQAQQADFAQALAELQQGQKRSHWIWWVLPQLRGLGTSPRAQAYGLSGLAEARAYLAHPVLGPRLQQCVAALLAHPQRSAEAMLGEVDALKLRSCLTLFARAAAEQTLFTEALQRFFGGDPDARTLALLAGQA